MVFSRYTPSILEFVEYSRLPSIIEYKLPYNTAILLWVRVRVRVRVSRIAVLYGNLFVCFIFSF